MRVLLLENTQEKANVIADVIKETGCVQESMIDFVQDINSSKKHLKENVYDLFIVDIKVPKRFGEKDLKDGGYQLIRTLSKQTLGYNVPSHIAAITEFDDTYDNYKEKFDEGLVSFIKYGRELSGWKNQLKNKIDLIKKSLSTSLIDEYKYDLAIICALDSPELEAVKELSNNWNRVNLPNTSIPFYKTIFDFGEKQLNVLAVSIDKMGMVATSVLATQVIENFRPRYLAMTGIAAGIKDEVSLGDILVVNPSWDFGAGKIKVDDDGNQLFEIDPRQEPIDSDINLNVLELSKDSSFFNKLRAEWKASKITNVLTVHSGPVASGAAVIADGEITKKIKLQSRKIIGIEMEAYGIIYAAKHATKPKPEPLVIKSVCDFADKEKNDGFQSYAAYTSAQFLYEYAKRYI